ncbi:hypothetical protein M0R04_10015 [Candidatus Dojkabacteria bacterium]|jgi:hypothetical protein|nr:hypothetical protein [Candidatus Dojkabacteria bacterium]
MNKPLTEIDYRNRINEAVPKGLVIPDHDKYGHHYLVPHINARYESVNGRIHIFKEEGLGDWRMNKALQYIYSNWKRFTDNNILNEIQNAEQQSVVELTDAGDIGTDIHNYREQIFSIYLKTGIWIEKFESIIPENKYDIRAVSALGALQKFVQDYKYVPVVTELYVYSEQLKLAGALDDIGLITTVVRKGNPECEHDVMGNNCIKCDLKYKTELCLMDLKSSNQLKPIYWIQVALYYHMFLKLTGIKPKKIFILKLDKKNRTYTVEYMKEISKVVRIAKRILKLSDELDWLKEVRKKDVEYI